MEEVKIEEKNGIENESVDSKDSFHTEEGTDASVAPQISLNTSEDVKDIKPSVSGVEKVEEYAINESSTSTTDPSELQKEPLFAEICSFFNMFAAYLNMKPLSFPQLEDMFCTNEDTVSHDLIDLHVTLLRKIGYKSARFDRYESFLQKFLIFNKDEDKSVQLERFGYANLPLTTKLEILFQLCERQFDFNLKFKESIFNTFNPCELRLAPIGYDRNGLSYWYLRDHLLNVRVYTEEPEDESGGTWAVTARSHNDILKLIESLKRTDFDQIKEENEEDVDESQLLERSIDSKKSQANAKKKGQELSSNFWKLLKPEVAEKYYKYLAKRNTFKDIYRDASDLNKRKNEKLQKKEAKANASQNTVPAPSATPKPIQQKTEKETSEEKEEEEPEIPPELLDDRRILPRRSARSNAISNLKTFTSTPSRKKGVTTPVEEKKKEESEQESSEDGEEEEFDEDNGDSDRSLGSSDEEFNLPGKKAKGKTRKARKPRPENEDGDTPKPKKKKKKIQNIVFEESSDEEEEQQEIKEKRKATEQTLCMQCHKSSKPEVLLLCDMCDDAWHTFCLKPALWYVPNDDWFCPTCHHAMLVDRFIKVEEELKEALKIKEAEEAKKKQAAERLKREMEYIGVSLNNIIPSTNAAAANQDPYQSMTESSESEDDGQRKSKKKAMKKVMTHSRKKERYYGPVVTVAEGRSRRSTKKVDYNFSAYDEQLQEAMDVIDEPSVKTKYENDHRPAGGLGRGKDMATIEEAQRKRSRDSDDFEDENNEPIRKKKKQKSKKLTDLDVDNATESEDDEYRASDGEEEEEPEPSEDDYVPSDLERKSRRRGNRRSDDDFIDDGGSDSDYNPSGRKRKGRQIISRRSGGRKKRKAWESDDESEEDVYQDDSSDDGYRKKKKKSFAPPPKKKGRKADYSDEEEEEVGDYQEESSDEGPKKKTARGRPMRKAAAQAVLKESDDEDEEEAGESEEGEKTANGKKKGESRPVGALTRKLDEEEFKPDDEEEDDEEENEEEEEEEKSEGSEDDEDKESDDVPDTGEEDEEAPTMVPPKRKAPSPPPSTKKKPQPKTKKENNVKDEESKKKASEKPEETFPPKNISPPTSGISTPKPSATPASNPPSGVSTPKPAPTPPRQQILVAPSPQPAHHMMHHLQTSSPGPIRPPLPQNGFVQYPPAMSHPNAVGRYPVPPHYVAPPGFYGPPMTYGHPQPPPLMPTYVMPSSQVSYVPVMPPSQGFPPNNLSMLEPLQSMHPMTYGGIQPIQLSNPSDSDGLAHAISGAMNTDL